MQFDRDFSNFTSALEWPEDRASFGNDARAYEDDFRSSIDWPEFRPAREEATGGGFKPLAEAVAAAFETIATSCEIGPDCESPIEVDLGAQISKALRKIGNPLLRLQPQFGLGPFRYDFAILRENSGSPLLLIECDGKEFHSSAEQIANDAAKNRLARSEGLALLRFTGSEIYRDVKGCVLQVIRTLRFQGQLSQQEWDAFEC